MPKTPLVTCPDERHIIRTAAGLIDGFLMSDFPRLYLVDRAFTDRRGMPHFIPKTNNACCLVPANWEGHGAAVYVPPYTADDPMNDPLFEALIALQDYYHEGRRWARACRCRFCGCAVHWASEWVNGETT